VRFVYRLLAVALFLTDAVVAAPAPALDHPVGLPFQDHRTRTLEVGPETEQHDPAGDEQVLIGWFGPTNTTDVDGGTAWWAASLAVREANENGGFQGKPFQLVSTWSANPWGSGVASLFRLIYEQHPRLLIGSVDGPTTHLAEQVVAKARLPLISPLATDGSVTLAGVGWTYALPPTDERIAAVLVEDVLRCLPTPKPELWLISATDHDARLAAKAIRGVCANRRVALSRHWPFQPGTGPSDRQLLELSHDPPAALLLVASARDGIRWLQALHPLRLPSARFGWHTMGRSLFLEQAGPSAENVRFPLLGVHDPESARATRFRRAAVAEFGHPPDFAASLTYDATHLALAAIQRGGLKRTAIHKSLAELSGREGLTGTVCWDGTGQNRAGRVVMATFIDGKPVPDSGHLGKFEPEARPR
jgi:branched-chain amino acid transport system substrate-binding protein